MRKRASEKFACLQRTRACAGSHITANADSLDDQRRHNSADADDHVRDTYLPNCGADRSIKAGVRNPVRKALSLTRVLFPYTVVPQGKVDGNH